MCLSPNAVTLSYVPFAESGYDCFIYALNLAVTVLYVPFTVLRLHPHRPHQPSEWEHILFAGTPDLYRRKPKSSDFQYESRSLKEAVCDHERARAPRSSVSRLISSHEIDVKKLCGL
jgi:hypothetical protein